MIRRFLSRRRRGAIAMVALAGMVPVTGMMSANLNTSQMIDDRRQAQDAADALATMHGVWSARALNIISMNNVTTAQLLSVAVGSEALFMTTTELTATATAAIGYIVSHEVQHCPPRTSGLAALVEAVIWSAPCVAWHVAVKVPASLAISRAADINSDFDPIHGIDVATKALEAIDGMNRALLARHPRAMAEIAEGYHGILDINDHHFADPCNGFGTANCSNRNSRDGMALPLKAAEFLDYSRMWQVMQTGTTAIDTTFNARGFSRFDGPLTKGGSRQRPHLRDYINHLTGIGTVLYDFKRFYSRNISDLPRHPFAGPGTAIGGGSGGGPGDPADDDSPFDDDTKDILDGLTDILENVDDITQSVLKVLRKLPLAYDRHPTWANLQGQQRRRGPNSFTRNFNLLHGLVMMPAVRERFPLGISFKGGFRFITAAPVPEITRLVDVNAIQVPPLVDPARMPDAFRILAFSHKEPSKRLGTAVLGAGLDHDGYGQVGLYNPDGATLYSQNWQARLMPATRLDAPRQAGSDLDREASASFDGFAAELRGMQNTTGWERVNAH